MSIEEDTIDRARNGDVEYFREAPLHVIQTAVSKEQGYSSFREALIYNKLECCKMIYSRCPSLLYHCGRTNRSTAMHQAAYSGLPHFIEYLISVNDQKDYVGEETDAESGQRREEIKNLNLLTMTDFRGYIPLHDAVSGPSVEAGKIKIVKMLIEADHGRETLKMVTDANETALHLAVKGGNIEIVTTLIEANPDLEYGVNSNGDSPLSMAMKAKSVTMQAQKEFSEDMQCKDKFLLQSAITISGDTDLYVIPKEDAEPEKQYSEIKKNPSHQRSNTRSESIENLLRELATDKPKQFSHEDLISFTSNLSTKLGSGAFGNVYKGQFLNDVEIAVKVLVENEVVEEEFMAEVSTMGRTYHRNLVKLYGFCFDDGMKALVYEYASNGSLDHVLYKNRFDLKWEKLYDIAIDTAKALVYLHDGCYHKIIHHDIKPANVLLDLNFSPKITDFGLAKLMSRNLSHLTMTRIRGTAGYAAPETWMPLSEITYKCDVYSFGMMLFEILGRRRNVTKEAWFPKQVWEKFENGQLDEIIVECGITVENKEKAKILCMVAFWCIQFTPETRPSMNTVSTMLEKEIRVTRPPNPFLSSLPISSMQPSQSSQEIIYSDVSSSISSIDESIN